MATATRPTHRVAGLATWAVALAAAALAMEGWHALRTTAPGPAGAMTSEALVLVGPAVLVLVALVLVAERVRPAVRRPLGAPGHRQDALYLALYVVVAVPVVTLVGTGFAVLVLRVAPWLHVPVTAGVPRWALVVLAVVVMDGCNWLAHLLNHRVTTCWRFHALHHSQEEMSILTSFRAHPIVHASFQLAALPLLILGTAGAVPLPVLVGYVLLSTLPHANVRWRFGPLGSVLVSPAYHRLHHDREDQRGVNLGTVLVLWDVLAGRAVFPAAAAEPVATGLMGRPIPVEQSSTSGLGLLGRQLAEPFVLPRPAPAVARA